MFFISLMQIYLQYLHYCVIKFFVQLTKHRILSFYQFVCNYFFMYKYIMEYIMEFIMEFMD
jgi:hypothetical protein